MVLMKKVRLSPHLAGYAHWLSRAIVGQNCSRYNQAIAHVDRRANMPCKVSVDFDLSGPC